MNQELPYSERYKLIKLGLLPKEAVAKPKKAIPKVSKKKKEEMADQKKGGDSKLDQWFEARRKEMTGRCVLCGGKTEKNNDEHYRKSIHHILEKRPNMFPSVALHSDNWLEVCFWNNSCHTNLHNGTITWELLRDSFEWSIIVAKFKNIYPFIHPNEHKNIPELLLKELDQ